MYSVKSQVVKTVGFENSLVVQWLGVGAFTAVGPDSVSDQGTKIPQVSK